MSLFEVVATPITGVETGTDASEPVQALRQFHTAFNTCDLRLIGENWVNSDEAAMDNPIGGITRGWPDIRSVYQRIFAAPVKIRVEFYDYTLHQAGGLFYVVGRERGTLDAPHSHLHLAIRTSRIFRRIDDRWRQVHHHGSIDDPQLLTAYRAAVQR